MSALGDVGNRTSKLGRYELITRIGEGGMAEVQLALQRGPAGFEKLVVVKLVHENLAAQKDFVDMLLDEARVAALLKHPNVVDIYDLGQADGRFFIAMEYLEGEPLLAVLRAGREGKRLDPLSTGRLIADTAEGLDAAHELRSMGGDPLELVHHDVSLGNIVVLYNGQVKLVDFGVAKATQSVSVSQNRRVQGKFSYMAPEKLRGHPGDRRSDIWSLGCVLWEALTLKRLFKGGNDSDTMRQVLESAIPVPSKINGDVRPAFDPIVMRALQRDPAQRYPTAKEMAHDLEEVLRTEGYGGKNEKIARYMQATFKAHIEARKRLLQEVSSKGRASADVLEAAFNDGMLASGSPVHTGDFSVRYKPNTIEVQPQPGKSARIDSTSGRPGPGRPGSGGPGSGEPGRRPTPVAQLAASPHQIEYPRAITADLPPIVAPEGEDEEDAAQTVLSPPMDESAEAQAAIDPDAAAPDAAAPDAAAPDAAARFPSKRGVTYLAVATVALAVLVVVLLIARRGDDRPRTDNTALLKGGSGDPKDAAQAAPDPSGGGSGGSAEGSGDGSGETQHAGAGGGSGAGGNGSDDAGSGDGSAAGSQSTDTPIEMQPDRLGPKQPKQPPPPPPPPPPPEKADPSALYRSGINAYVVGDMRTAMTHFKRAIAVNPSFAMAWRGVGMVHERLGDARSATTAFQRYLQLAPNARDAATIRGKIGGSR